MKKRQFLPKGTAAYGALLALLLLGIGAFLFRTDFSFWEKRYLAGLPRSFSLTSWTLQDDLETYLSDQIPFRHQLVNLDSSVQVLTGRAAQLDAWPTGGVVVEKPVQVEKDTLLRRVEGLRAVAGEIPYFFLTPPTAGMMHMNEMTAPRKAVYAEESVLYDSLSAQPGFIPLLDSFRDSAAPVFYNTDHHWNLHGAYLAYCAYCQAADLTPLPLEDYTLTEYAPFYGTTYSRSGLPFARADTLICAEPQKAVTLIADGETYDHLLFPEEAQTYDGYAVYLKGNHGILTIETPSAPEETLLIFKDSFANSMIPFLCPHYSQIIAVDARYYPSSFYQALADAGHADRILFLYSLDSLANDTSIARKIQKR